MQAIFLNSNCFEHLIRLLQNSKVVGRGVRAPTPPQASRSSALHGHISPFLVTPPPAPPGSAHS